MKQTEIVKEYIKEILNDMPESLAAEKNAISNFITGTLMAASEIMFNTDSGYNKIINDIDSKISTERDAIYNFINMLLCKLLLNNRDVINIAYDAYATWVNSTDKLISKELSNTIEYSKQELDNTPTLRFMLWLIKFSL